MITIDPLPVPLRVDADGVIRVGGTRVTLDTVVLAFKEGLSAEEIAEQYSSLNLGDVYAAIGYFLKHRPEIESYLAGRRTEAASVREQNETRFGQRDLRGRLLARRVGERGDL